MIYIYIYTHTYVFILNDVLLLLANNKHLPTPTTKEFSGIFGICYLLGFVRIPIWGPKKLLLGFFGICHWRWLASCGQPTGPGAQSLKAVNHTPGNQWYAHPRQFQQPVAACISHKYWHQCQKIPDDCNSFPSLSSMRNNNNKWNTQQGWGMT